MPRVSGFLFKTFVQLVLIFGAETWVVAPCIGWFLRGFQDQVARRLMGWRGDWWGGFHGIGRTKIRSTPRWRQCKRSLGLIRWKPTFGKVVIWSCSILQRDHLWTSVSRQRGSRGHGWICGDGDRQKLTWKGQGRWRRLLQTRMGWINKGGWVNLEDLLSCYNSNGYIVANLTK